MKKDVSKLTNLELLNALEKRVADAVYCNDESYRHIRVDISNLKREINRRMK